ncbi:hypothetical protein D931_01888 [Enterococcus faecium 13.SD.W.09]|nr:hypothetical protein D931_01888 [Enterococcus faecium 13.SD.W.09]
MVIRHYIDIDLLTPKGRSQTWYIFFDKENIYKLHQILVFKNNGYNQFITSDIILIVVTARRTAVVVKE